MGVSFKLSLVATIVSISTALNLKVKGECGITGFEDGNNVANIQAKQPGCCCSFWKRSTKRRNSNAVGGGAPTIEIPGGPVVKRKKKKVPSPGRKLTRRRHKNAIRRSRSRSNVYVVSKKEKETALAVRKYWGPYYVSTGGQQSEGNVRKNILRQDAPMEPVDPRMWVMYLENLSEDPEISEHLRVQYARQLDHLKTLVDNGSVEKIEAEFPQCTHLYYHAAPEEDDHFPFVV